MKTRIIIYIVLKIALLFLLSFIFFALLFATMGMIIPIILLCVKGKEFLDYEYKLKEHEYLKQKPQ